MQSMTGFAAAAGAAEGRRWRWEAKSVNGRGLDLRFRLDDTLPTDEGALRSLAAKALSRGSVTISLRAERGDETATLTLNQAALETAVAALAEGEAAARAVGVDVAASAIAPLLAIKGVLEQSGEALDEAAEGRVKAALSAGFAELMQNLAAARADEGAGLKATVAGLVDKIEAGCAAAEAAFDAQMADAPTRLKEKVAALQEAGAEPAPERLAQELALLAVKADVREELDRLATHIAAARDLIESAGPIGRKLDFLTQEFNREANTLCSKAGSAALTQAGLDLKVLVDQLREQAQNVE